MKGQGLCDGNVIVNLYGQLRLWRLDALQILKYTLGFHLFLPPPPPQIIATERESLIPPSKWTRRQRKAMRLSATEGTLEAEVSPYTVHMSHVTQRT